ncbi:MAG: hypothetical protein AMS18_07800 [Gemmatimonas sp. SG8_17]|nr:MAG: hypothetical protein AMS18_07800 [Gemmatimonas sp. SG8_17]
MSVGHWFARYRLVLLAGVVFVTFAQAALAALPLAALLVMTSVRTRRELVVAAIAGGLSLAWLFDAGSLPDQVVRTSAVLATASYALVTRFQNTTVIHRCLLAVAVTAVAVGGMLPALGSSWGELHWWVEYQVGCAARVASQLVWLVGNGTTSSAAQLSMWVSDSVRFMSDYFAGILALQLIAGLYLATAIYHRVAPKPHGPGLGKFTSFRFNEQVGWAAIAALLVVLLPKLAAFKVGAVNLLLVMGTLYALRGVAVAGFGIQLLAGGRVLLIVVAAVAASLMLPIALAGAILLGVVDSGLDLRRRWLSPRAD